MFEPILNKNGSAVELMRRRVNSLPELTGRHQDAVKYGAGQHDDSGGLFCSVNGPWARERDCLLNLVDPTVSLKGRC